MRYRVRSEVFEAACRNTGATTDEELAVFLRRSVATVRNWRAGRSAPDVAGLMRLLKLTGIPLESLVYETDEPASAA